VDAFLNEIAGSLASGRRVECRGFGVFDVVLRAERSAYDINAGKSVRVPACVAARFRPGRQLDQVVKKYAGEEAA